MARQKRKLDIVAQDLDISLSDVEEDRFAATVNVSIETMSNDFRRVHRREHNLQVRVDKAPAPEDLDTPADNFFVDLGAIDIDAVQTENKRVKKDSESRRARYVSSVNIPRLRPSRVAH